MVAQRDALKRDLDEALQRLAVAQQMVQGREREKQVMMITSSHEHEHQFGV